MGDVWKAEDTKLGRAVALKLLASHLLRDEDARKRFDREARAAAALSHPNITMVHEIDEADGKSFIAMAFIEGESLDKKIAQGPLKLEEALSVAQQIAEGLEAAHERGIHHRDIKPENVIIDAQGRVTIMDFGLAQLTEASRLTRKDETVGTVFYMSPEQTEGSGTDHRTDIWALGCVLYEMITGQQPFKGDYDKAVMYSILNEEPEPMTALRTGVPIELEVAVNKCIAKKPADRYQRVGDLGVDLRTLADKVKSLGNSKRIPAIADAAARDQTINPARLWLRPAVAALVATVVASLVFFLVRPEPVAPPVHLSIALPPGQEITSSPAISDDGQIIAYTAQLGTDQPQLYLRHLDSFEARLIAGATGADQPFFSPDGKWVAFFAQGQLQKVEAAGGAPIPLAEASFPFGGTWSEDDTIIYAASIGSGLLRVPATGGEPEVLTRPDGASAGYLHGYPHVLPGGQSVLFDVQGQTSGGAVLSLDSGQWEIVLPMTRGVPAIFDESVGSPGRLLQSDLAGGIRAAPFDPAHPALTSAGVSILTDVYYDSEEQAWLALSSTGTAVYVPGNPAKSSLMWADRQGRTESLGVDQGRYQGVRLSPDGTKAVVNQGDGLWTLDLVRGTRIRLTPAGISNHLPLWSSDSARVVFASNRGGDWDIYSQPADASAPAETVLSRPFDQSPDYVFADGALIYEEVNPETGFDLWTLASAAVSQERIASPLRVTAFNERHGVASPGSDGGPRWIAYASDESGRSEIYVQSYPAGTNRIPVSTAGGDLPRWSPSGRELFYVTGDAVASVEVRPDGSISTPRMLFDRANFFFDPNHPPNYGVSPDGERFLLVHRDEGSVPRQINVILNWGDQR